MWGGCLERRGDYVEGVGRLLGGCGEGLYMLWEAAWRFWKGCLEGIGRLSRGCEEALWRVRMAL